MTLSPQADAPSPPTNDAGVVTGPAVERLYTRAKTQRFAIPAVNCTGSNTITATLETATRCRGPVAVQFSAAGAAHIAGEGLNLDPIDAAAGGAAAAAHFVHSIAPLYGVPVVLHTDHAGHDLLPWVDRLLDAGERHYETNGVPLFSSHMLDLSSESIEQNVDTSCHYFERMTAIGMTLEVEIGVTGGEEDGVDNTSATADQLYSNPHDVAYAYRQLGRISPRFTIAAAFGNVHGVYSPGGVELRPSILGTIQSHVRSTLDTGERPAFFVFHGGSGCDRSELREAIDHGVVKVNLDTDLQWALWDGVRSYAAGNHDELQQQIGTPTDPDQPNNKAYHSRRWLRAGERGFSARLAQSFEDLDCVDRLP